MGKRGETVSLPFEAAPEVNDFRLLLQGELVRRCRNNPKYSLRAFARFLQMDHSTLSQILRGKRKLSPAASVKIGERLGLSPVHLMRLSGGAYENPEAPDPKGLSLDAFQVIADWYHYSIFELVTVAHFKPSSKLEKIFPYVPPLVLPTT